VDEINLDASTGISLVSEASPARKAIKAAVAGKQMVMTETAEQEFTQLISQFAGQAEKARALRLLGRVMIIPDDPSVRAQRLRPTNNLEPTDIIVFGTGDRRGIITTTSDRRAVSAALSQGVRFAVFFHDSVRLQGV
jgi:Protein of unknown function (DUF1308)